MRQFFKLVLALVFVFSLTVSCNKQTEQLGSEKAVILVSPSVPLPMSEQLRWF